MALIACTVCGSKISDQAATCPNCGTKVGKEDPSQKGAKMSICAECGAEIPADAQICCQCGYPVQGAVSDRSTVQKVEIAAVRLPKMHHAAKKNIILGLLGAALIIALAALGIHQHNRQMAARISSEYYDNLDLASYTMLLGASDAEAAGNLIKKVWYNSIYEERDAETDPYTRPHGYFYSDFNDALAELFSDSSFKDSISAISNNQKSVAELMKNLKNPPPEYEEAYDAIKKYYDEYLAFTNLVINPSGSLQTFSNQFNTADSNTLNAYNAVKLYID